MTIYKTIVQANIGRAVDAALTEERERLKQLAEYLRDSEDDTGCDGGLTVVSKRDLDNLVERVLSM